MNSDKYINEVEKIQKLIEDISFNNNNINTEELFFIIEEVKEILNEVYYDIKCFQTIKKELLKIDFELQFKMMKRNQELNNILDLIV